MCWCNGNGGTLQPLGWRVGGSSLPAPTHMWYLKGLFVPVSGDHTNGDGEGRFVPINDDGEGRFLHVIDDNEDGDDGDNDGFDDEDGKM